MLENLGNSGDILGVVKNIFSSFSSLIFLLIAVFLGLWLFERILDIFLTLPEFAKEMALTKTEKSEVGLLVKMAKSRGLTLSKNNLLAGLKKKKIDKKYNSLMEKYGDIKV
jgi:hypothetical protein